MFSQVLNQWIDEGFAEAAEFMRDRSGGRYFTELSRVMEECDADTQTIMKYYISAMPFSDIADTDMRLLKRYAEHSVFLRRNVQWCSHIPEKTFLTDIAAYRINNEKIMDCRELFYRELMPRVAHMTMEDAVIEANYWCAEHASYHLADSRTASALTVYRSGFGRCGEESVFLVTVLRSIGIPARQVYTPLWAHCDDNHAWVEAWCSGKWYFLGACEPEEILNKGWFTSPASRAMLLHAKYFTCIPMDDAQFREGYVNYVNRTGDYAHTTQLKICVREADGRPARGVRVYFELLNMAFYGCIASKDTDENGCVSIELGIGDLRVSFVRGNESIYRDINSAEGYFEVIFDPENAPEDKDTEYRIKAPDFAVLHPGIINEEQRERGKKRSAEADRMRIERLEGFFDAERAARFPACEQRLKSSAGNFEELIRFLGADSDPLREKLLLVLSEKDMYDVTNEILEEHLKYAAPYKEMFAEDIFVRYILNPRVEDEELSLYREFISRYFSDEEKEEFFRCPEAIWEYTEKMDSGERSSYERLRISPAGALRLGIVDEMSRKILFCAICRTLGVPARIDPRLRHAEYYQDGQWIVLDQKKEKADSVLRISFEEGQQWNYFRDWTLSRKVEGRFRPVGLHDRKTENNLMEVELPAGSYLLISSVRLPIGDQLVHEYQITIRSGEVKSVLLTKDHPKETDLLTDKPVEPVRVAGRLLDMPGNGGRQIVLWLEPGKEPTQHVLNELKDNREICMTLSDQIEVLIQEEKDSQEAVFAEVMKEIPCLKWKIPENWSRSENIAQSFNLPAYQYPLVYVRDREDHVIYADCGYNAGSVDLMLRLLVDKH